jgi:nucleotide-binding universal stress UspA family protein
MRHLLVGIDGSDDSRAALRWAAALAHRLELPLHALQAWQYPPTAILPVGGSTLPGTWRTDEEIETTLRGFIAEVLGDQPAVEVVPHAGHGPAAAALLQTANRHTEQLIVGSRGLGGFKGLLLGSVSHQLAEFAPCPVSVVRRPADVPASERVTHLLVGTDGSDHAARAVGAAGELAARLEVPLTVTLVVAPRRVREDAASSLDASYEDLEATWAGLRDEGVDLHFAVAVGDARTILLEVAHDRGADLLVVGSRGLGPVKKLMLGSVATALIAHSDVPTMIVPPPR